MKIGFLPVYLSERGTTTATYDYAYHNQKLLGNSSIIFYQKKHPLNFQEYEKKFNAEFTCYEYENFSEVDDIIKKEGIDALYAIKCGSKDNLVVKNCPNLVHAVFVKEPHGEKYAFVSRFLSEKYGSDIPYVPHMIDLPKEAGNLREQYGIPEDAVVFGGFGGRGSFNLAFVHDTINQVVHEMSNIYFLFMNFERHTIPHQRIIYLEPTVDKNLKVRFINTCDAMIHARSEGETFGLAVGEFSSCNKPVITVYNKELNIPKDKEHIRILGDKGIYYKDADELKNILRNFKVDRDRDWNCYKEYNPCKVMETFEKVFLNIVTCKYDNKTWTLFQNDGISRHVINGEGWEPHLVKLFKELINVGDVILDIGANFGYHTMTMAEAVGPSGKVYAYEPEKYIHGLLLRNIKNNNFSNIYPKKFALSDKNEIVRFTKTSWLAKDQNMGDSYITPSGRNGNEVLCKKLDDIYDDRIDLLKLDVQGCETLVLNGMSTLLQKWKPYMVVEIEEYTLNRFGHTSKSLIDTIIGYGYTIFYIEYQYPSDHLCVPNTKLEAFKVKYAKYIKMHHTNNTINNNVKNGITHSISFIMRKSVHPISFSIHSSKIVKTMPVKTKLLAYIEPGNISTYIYSNEEDYYNDYKSSYFALTKKKAGWDCMRHYEILANGCIPLFLELEKCPSSTMTHFPKELVLQAMNLYELMKNGGIDDEEIKIKHKEYVMQLLEYTRNNLTNTSMAKYVLATCDMVSVKRVLFFSPYIMPDYLRCMTLSGFKELFGKECHDYPKIPHLYSDYGNVEKLYGKGISFTKILTSDLHDNEYDSTLTTDIESHRYNVVVYASYHGGTPYWDLVHKFYKPSEIILLCGEDEHRCNYQTFVDKGYNIFVRELK